MNVDVHTGNEPVGIKRNRSSAVDVDYVGGSTRKIQVLQRPVLSVDDAVLVAHDERGDFGITRPERGDDLLLADHLLVRHQEVVQAVLLGTARLDLELSGEKSVKVSEVPGTISEDVYEVSRLCSDHVAERYSSARIDVIANRRKALVEDICTYGHFVQCPSAASLPLDGQEQLIS